MDLFDVEGLIPEFEEAIWGPDLFFAHEVEYMAERRAVFFQMDKTGEIAISNIFPVGPGVLDPTDADLVIFKNRPIDPETECVPEYLCEPKYIETHKDDRYWLYWPCNKS